MRKLEAKAFTETGLVYAVLGSFRRHIQTQDLGVHSSIAS